MQIYSIESHDIALLSAIYDFIEKQDEEIENSLIIIKNNKYT